MSSASAGSGTDGAAERRFGTLLQAAAEGAESAWTEIYRDLAPTVLGYLRANGALEPEDTLSEVFLQVARDLGRFEGGERHFRAWVFTIAHHRMIDARRRSARRPVELAPEPPEPPRSAADDVAEGAMARFATEEVHRVLERLSPDQRAVLLLRVLGELTVDEVARALGKRPGAVKALQRRGLAALRKELAKGAVTL